MKRRQYTKAVAAMGIGSIAGCTGMSGSDEFPSQSLTHMIPFGEGGGTDLMTRSFIDPAEEEYGVSIAPQNNPGAGGGVCYQQLANSQSDGYTVGTYSGPNFHYSNQFFDDINYSPFEDFTWINQWAQTPMVAVSRYDAEWDTLAELIEVNGNSTTGYGAIGTIGAVLLGLEHVAQDTELELELVTHSSGGEIMNSVQSGRVAMGGEGLGPAITGMQEERLKPIAIFTPPEDRIINHFSENMGVELDENLFITEQGLVDNPLRIERFVGMIAPAGVSDDRINALQEGAMNVAEENSSFWQNLTDLGELPEFVPGNDAKSNVEEQHENLSPHLDLMEKYN